MRRGAFRNTRERKSCERLQSSDCRGAEARLRGLGQRPDAEVLAAGDLLAVPVLPLLARSERKAEGLDVERAALRRVGGDHGESLR